jgi:hypothetical protein
VRVASRTASKLSERPVSGAFPYLRGQARRATEVSATQLRKPLLSRSVAVDDVPLFGVASVDWTEVASGV